VTDWRCATPAEDIMYTRFCRCASSGSDSEITRLWSLSCAECTHFFGSLFLPIYNYIDLV
jgi:hypothetical protein